MNLPTRSLPERYSGAISTSHLEVLPTPGDVDMLIATGWVRDPLGGLLLRLRAEWDAASGDYKLAKRHMREAEHMGRIMAREAENSPGQAGKILKQRDDMLASAERAARTAHAIALTHLKTLDAAKHEVAEFALKMAVRQKFDRPPEVVIGVAQRALQVWLDERCPFCGGRGFTGGAHRADPKVICQQCDEGRARLRMGDSDRAHEFGRALLRVVDKVTTQTHDRWKQFLSRRDGPLATDYPRALTDRLRDLNSTQAAED